MKKRTLGGKRMAALGLSLALLAVGTGCGSSRGGDMMEAPAVSQAVSGGAMNGIYKGDDAAEIAWADEGVYDDMLVANSTAESLMPSANPLEPSVDNSAYYADRKLIKTVNLETETKEFDQMVATVEAQVESLGGYIENMYSYNGSKYNANRDPIRNANMTVRIPKRQLNVFLDSVSAVSNVVSRSENVEDVTLAYVDLESHRDALKAEQKRMLELLEKAESMEDIITLEDHLSYIRYQLESMESQLRTYDNKVDFATVIMNIREVKELTHVREETVWERIGNGFMDNLRDMGDWLLDLFIWFVIHIPNLLIWVVVIVIAVVVIKGIRRKLRKKKEAKMQGQTTQDRTENENQKKED